jgi:hypothetical protein
MATYSPSQLGITAPSGGFQQGGWYSGRQYWDGTLSDPGVIHPSSNQQGAGQVVSDEVNRQSDVAQGLAPGTIKTYLEGERNKQQQNPAITPVSSQRPMANSGVPSQSFSDAGSSQSGWDGSLMPTEQLGFDLPQVYESMYKKSGIEDLQNKLSEQEKAYIEAKGVINDNPFLSEATRVGRIAKIESLYNERTANLRGDIATKKADIETQLNLELKQMDLRSEATQLAWQQFNTLLGAGALDYASDEALANITRQTGIPSSMLKSAIHTRTKEDVETSVIQSQDDNGNVTVSVVNTKTGEIINQQSLGAIGKKTEVKESEPSQADTQRYYINNLQSDVLSGLGVRDVFSIYSGYIDPNQILQIYNANSPHGSAKESADELSKLGVDVELFGYY